MDNDKLLKAKKHQVFPQDKPDTPQDKPKKYQVTPQDKPDTPQDKSQKHQLTTKEMKKIFLLELCKEPKSITELLQLMGLKDRKNFLEGYIKPLQAEGLLTMTDPDKPTVKSQRYITILK